MRLFSRDMAAPLVLTIGALAYWQWRLKPSVHASPDLPTRSNERVGKDEVMVRLVNNRPVKPIASQSGFKSATEYLSRTDTTGRRWLEITLRAPEPDSSNGAKELRYAAVLQPLDARSPEEAQWLAERGYPSSEEFHVASSGHSDLPELAKRAAQADLTALGLLGVAQLQLGQFEAGQANLEEAAARGSVFALIALGMNYSLSRDPRLVMQAVALHNLAVMRGDYLATEYGFVVRHSRLDVTYKGQILVMRYWQNLNAYRASLGLPPFASAMRPGFDIEQPTGSTQVPVFAHRGG